MIFVPFLPYIAILLYCSYTLYPLFHEWVFHPLKDSSSIAFILWLTPTIIERTVKRSRSPFIAFTALAFSFIGFVGELNIFCQIGFTLAMASFWKFRSYLFLWILCSISWYSSLEWFTYKTGLPINGIRISIALTSIICWKMYAGILRKD